jgi:hypothetical protein
MFFYVKKPTILRLSFDNVGFFHVGKLAKNIWDLEIKHNGPITFQLENSVKDDAVIFESLRKLDISRAQFDNFSEFLSVLRGSKLKHFYVSKAKFVLENAYYRKELKNLERAVFKECL